MNLLESTIWPEALCTDDNNANTDAIEKDNAIWFHKAELAMGKLSQKGCETFSLKFKVQRNYHWLDYILLHMVQYSTKGFPEILYDLSEH